MSGRTVRMRVVLALVAPVAILTVGSALLPEPGQEVVLPSVPPRIGAWSGQDLDVSPRTLQLLGTERVVYREYDSARGEEILLCIVGASGAERAIHPPEVCYRGWGFEIVERGVAPLVAASSAGEEIRANWLELTRGSDRLLAVFWYRDARGFHTGFVGRRFRGALGRILGRSTGWSLVRLSTPLEVGETREGAMARIREFARAVVPYLESAGGI